MTRIIFWLMTVCVGVLLTQVVVQLLITLIWY